MNDIDRNQVVIYIAGAAHNVQPGLRTGLEIRTAACLSTRDHLLLDIEGELDVTIDEQDLLVIVGGERFAVSSKPASYGGNPCLRQPACFSLNGKNHTSEHLKIKSEDIAKLALGHSPRDGLFVDIPDLPDFMVPPGRWFVLNGCPSFLTVPCGNVGESPHIQIFDSHLSKLKIIHPDTEVVVANESRYVILRNVPLPNGWNRKAVDMLFLIPARYPSTPLDMFYLSPQLLLSNGTVPLKAEVTANFNGEKWQRFSWHYKEVRWDPCTSSLVSHLYFCLQRLNFVG